MILVLLLVAAPAAWSPGPRIHLGGASLVLPAGWRPIHGERLGPTEAVDLFGPSRAPGRVVLSAAAPKGQGSLFVAKVPGTLDVGGDTRDDLAVRAPDVLRRLWGVDYRVLWADVVPMAGRKTLRLEGAIERGRTRWSVLVTLVPDGRIHWLVVYLLPGSAPKARYRAVARSLASFDPGPAVGEGGARPLSRGLVGAAAGGLVGLVLALGVRLRRQRSARTSG